MRPMTGDSAFGRPRTAARDDDAIHASGPSASSSHMSFVFAEEASVDSYIDQSPSCSRPLFRDHRKHYESSTAQTARRDDKGRDKCSRPTSVHRPDVDSQAIPYSPMSRDSEFTCSPLSFSTQNQLELSRPITPIMLGPSISGSSAISSPSSRRDSLVGFYSEHALCDEEDQATPYAHNDSPQFGSGGAPELVMPSIKMPTRRPFTETGKSLGRLKVFLAGDSGVGKTSLIKAITQSCPHLVHVDTVSPQTQDASKRLSGSKVLDELRPTAAITEILGSTKPFPEWWSELEGASSRRKSLGDGVLDRNICFVDTPGFSRGSSAMETIVPCVEYIESQFQKMESDSLSDSDLLNVLGGSGGFQTDAVLYMIRQRLKPADLEYVRRLNQLTNVIPVLARVDTLSPQQIKMCKEQISMQLRDAGIRTFSFQCTRLFGSDDPGHPAAPYAVSCAKGSDHDTMDASLLMSSDYVQPLLATDLSYMVDRLFSSDGVAWLRHAAARKYLEWKNRDQLRPRHLYQPLRAPGPSPGPLPSNALVRFSAASQGLVPPMDLTTRYTDLDVPLGGSRLYIADWAADLQRSLAADRDQRCQLPVTIGTNEANKRGALVAARGRSHKRSTSGGKQRSARKTKVQQDPLGLLQVSADLKASSWVALELLGSLGLLGGLAFWLSRHHWHSDPALLIDDWARLWGIEY